MYELIPVEINENQEPIVSGRVLYEFLEVKTRYNDWIERKLDYGFIENIDYVLLTQKRVTNNPKNPEIEITDHALKLDMAKELAMLERNEKGKEARRYFIQVEKDWNSPEKIMARALEIAHQKLRYVNAEKVELLTELDKSKEYYTIKRVASINNMHWKKLQWKLLKNESDYMQIEVRKIFDANYGNVNAYYIDVWKNVYPNLIYQ